MERPKHYPGIAQAVWLLVLFVLLQAGLGGLLWILSGIVQYPFFRNPTALALANLVAAGLILMQGFGKTGAPFGEVFPFRSFRASLLVPMALTVAGVHILLSELDNLLRTLLPVPTWVSEMLQELSGGKTSVWGSVFLLAIVAPVTEELLFRGLILRGFVGRYGVKKAVLVSAALFAVVHLNLFQAPMALVLGVLLAWWFIETRSLLPCLFGHALNNSLGLLVSNVLRVEIPGYTGDPSASVRFQPLWFDALGVALAVTGLWLLLRRFRTARPSSQGSSVTVSEGPEP